MPRLVATADTHYPFEADLIPDGDIFIHGGDLMYSGYVDEWYPRVASLAALNHKDKILIPGNHDFHIQNYEGVARAELRRAGVRVIGTTPDNAIRNVQGLRILGIPFVTGLQGWAYDRSEDWLYDYLRQFNDEVIDVVVSHAPMFGMLDAIYPEKQKTIDQLHVGGLATNRWYHQLKQKPKVWINGHIHESYGRHLTDETAFYNVAMCDRQYDQVNQPMVIEL